jgi:hypothetical protein
MSVVAGVLAFALPTRAYAAAPSLETEGVEACPPPSELRRGIAAQLGRDDFDAPGAPDVRVRITPEHDTLVAHVTIATSNGPPTTRTIDGAPGTCADLVRAAALTIALALEAESPRPAPAPAPTPAPTLAPAPDRDAAPSRAAHDLRTDHLVLLASGIATLGLLPRASTGGAANVRLRIADAIWLSARGLFLPEARMPNDAFGMTLVAGGAGVCLEPFGSSSVAAVGCAHVVGGSLAVVDAGVPMRNGGAKPFGAATLSAGARARVAGPLTLEGAVEASVPFTHPTFLTETCPSSGFEQPFSAVALVFGAGVSIP